MDVLNAMRAFERVAEAGSFSRAAEQLNSSVPTITRLIGQLEERLNIRLFQRTTRRISLTDAGATYLEGCKRALELIDDTENQVTSANDALRGRLKVMSGSAVAFSHMAPVVADFVHRYPLIQLDFFTMDDGFNLVDEAVEVALLADYLIPTETVVARQLITYSYVIAAAPRYLSSAGRISTPSDLQKLVFLGRPGDRRGMSLRLAAAEGAEEDEIIDLIPQVICNNAQMLHELTLSGCGFSVLPQRLAQTAIAGGKLVQLLPEYRLRDLNVDVCLVYPTRKRNSRIATAFIDHVIQWFDSPDGPAKT
ncbi:LysR family transcriptional regulator [Burkholderia gladioli]|uniref:LysR family transcriptional regulator n=1 Tax=Burkholderia gladioli TaxID=28095 RepID=UPI000CFF3453|nr:LysR family transcriptional regulator [Burkholderia gladioli]PRE77831.1 hypothetical protein C6Q13_34675 [Burkholderia gladioli]